MRYWLDCEFQEDGRTIDLISIGLVDEKGATYYAEAAEYNRKGATPWLKGNVIPLLQGGESVKTREELQTELKAYLGRDPEIWGWYGAYDWVAFCQIFGTMMDLPAGWPMFIREAMQHRAARNYLPLRFTPSGEPLSEHHALNDALWQKEVWLSLVKQGMINTGKLAPQEFS